MHRPPLILIVDDESHILHVVSLKLKSGGYRVITAEDGEEGVAVALQQQPDMIISDYQMPYMTGMEMCLKLREHPSAQWIPVIMLTARGFTLGQEQLDRANIAVVMSKPFSPRDILTHVRDLVGEPAPVDQETSFTS